MSNGGNRRSPESPRSPNMNRDHDEHASGSRNAHDPSRSNVSRRSRGYPTGQHSWRRSDSGGEHHQSPSRSSSRGREPALAGSSQGRDHDDGRSQERRYQRSRSDSYHGPAGRNYSDDANDYPRRGRASSRGKSEDNYYGRASGGSSGGKSEDNYYGRASDASSRGKLEDHYYSRASDSKSKRPPTGMPPPKERETPEWPPCFNHDGSAFILDARSSMFYEAQSDFFYDPVSKLYYGNKKGAYFRYDEANDPPFVVVQKSQPTQNVEFADGSTDLLPIPTSSNNKTTMPMIAIKLKTKKVKRPRVAEAKVVEPKAVVSKSQKEHVAHIEKWTEKQAELKANAGSSKSVALSITDNSSTKESGSSMRIQKTIKGEPICVICKRKFSNLEKLRLHENVSELHKQNLAKLTTAQNGKRKETPQPDYMDRAKKRRALHGPSNTVVVGRPIAKPEPALEKTAVAENLGANNIGNKLLQKMGWESGSSLGKRSGGAAEASSTGTPADITADNLRKDWERIEAMAAGKRGKFG